MASEFRRSIAAAVIIGAALSGCAQHRVAQVPQIPVPACGSYTPYYAASADGHGYATAIILENMVADPTDLINPDLLPLPYGDAAVAPAQRHREGRVKGLSGDAVSSSELPAGGEAPKQQ